jgi:carboxyl-terminal processing protease
MSLSLEGIGAQLTTEDDYTVVHSIIPGGPAFKDGRLKAEDKIVGVAQGEDGEMVDVIGWKINDVIQLIRGKKGTVVRLNVLSKDDGINALPHEIKIVRDKVKLEEQSAKSDVINIDENNVNFKLGVITIPSFYIDFEAKQKGDPNYKSTTRDVRKILSDFKKENIDGVIIDLRNNGGGSLEEAIKLSGLFIKEGPVVQVKNTNNVIEVDKDPDPNIIYSGPLAVMVNRYSASASEIFSAAIQDYDRGVIVGEQTYGKGTVQNMVDLNRFIPINDKRLGQIKLTIAKFYRISGGSTQDKGVIPDITFPSDYDPSKYGESSRPSAFPGIKLNLPNIKSIMMFQNIFPN